jgi:N-acetyl-gamma-glutamyl-phosphate reductase
MGVDRRGGARSAESEIRPPSSRLIANPGCYATAVLLALWPIRHAIDPDDVVADAKSGVSGAGRVPCGGAPAARAG